jgi:hypothetical protein
VMTTRLFKPHPSPTISVMSFGWMQSVAAWAACRENVTIF